LLIAAEFYENALEERLGVRQLAAAFSARRRKQLAHSKGFAEKNYTALGKALALPSTK
jgi:hypothetical protein